MQSFLTVLGYQFILVFTEYWCKQMPKLPVILKYAEMTDRVATDYKTTADFPRLWSCWSLCSAPLGQDKRCPDPGSAPPHVHTHQLGKWCAAELTPAFPQHWCPHNYTVSKSGTEEAGFIWRGFVQLCLLIRVDPFWSLGLWTRAEQQLPQWSEVWQSGHLFPQHVDLWLFLISSVRGNTFLPFFPSMTFSQSVWVLVRQLTNNINSAWIKC